VSVLHGLKTDVIANLGKMRSAAGTWDQSLLRKGTGFRNGQRWQVNLWSFGARSFLPDCELIPPRRLSECCPSRAWWKPRLLKWRYCFDALHFFSQTWFCTESILPFVGFKFHSVIRQESFCAGHGRAEAKQERIHCRCVSKDFGQQGGVLVT